MHFYCSEVVVPYYANSNYPQHIFQACDMMAGFFWRGRASMTAVAALGPYKQER